jgi:hypothetical protein
MRYPISENVDVMSYLLENELSRDSTMLGIYFFLRCVYRITVEFLARLCFCQV